MRRKSRERARIPVIVQPLEVGHLALELEFRHLAEQGVPLADDVGELALQPLDLGVLAADELVLLLEDALDVLVQKSARRRRLAADTAAEYRAHAVFVYLRPHALSACERRADAV